MLTINSRTQNARTFCDGISRRRFIQIGSIGTFGLNLPDLLRAEQTGANAPGGVYVQTLSTSSDDPGHLALNPLALTFDATDMAVVDVAANRIVVAAHGFRDGDALVYASASTAIGGLTSGTAYFVVGSTGNSLQLAATSGGSAIDLTGMGLSPSTEPKLP